SGLVVNYADSTTDFCNQIQCSCIAHRMVPDGKFSRQRLHLVALPPFIKAICETGFVVFSQRVTSSTQIMWHPQLAKGHLLGIVIHSITTSRCTTPVPVGGIIRLTRQRLEFGFGSDCLSQTSIGN